MTVRRSCGSGRGRRGTVLALVLSFGAILGGWLFTRELLQRQEEDFLSQMYLVTVNLPGEERQESTPSWEGYGRQEASALPEDTFQGRELDGNTVAQILEVWQEGGREILHEPGEGQMTMEQALEESRRWIGEMEDQGVLPREMEETEDWHFTARLCSLDREVAFDRELLSLWQVSYRQGEERIELSLHAVSGRIWQAQITLKDSRLYPARQYDGLLPLVFPFLKADEGESVSIGKTFYQSFEGGSLTGAFCQAGLMIDEEEPLRKLSFWLLPPAVEEAEIAVTGQNR